MKFKGLYILVIITLILQPVSFTLAQDQVEEPLETQSLYFPMLRNYIPPVIPDTTKVLPEDTLQFLEGVSEDGTLFSFSQYTLALQDLEPGDVMVGEPVDGAPGGFLRVVSGVTENGAGVVVETVDATIEDAIQDGAVSVQIPLSQDDIQESSLTEGVELVMLPAGADQLSFTYLIDRVLYEENGAQIIAKGSLSFKQDFNFDISIRRWKLQNLSFYITAEETAQLSIESTLSKEAEGKIELATHKFKPITLWIGIVPVVLTPELTVYVGFNGEVSVGVTTGVTQVATAKAGLMYGNSRWSPIYGFDNDFDYTPPTLTGDLSLKGFVGVELALKLYGAAGVKAKAQAYLLLEAGLDRVPWWELYIGFEVLVGVEFEVLSRTIVEYEFTVIDYKLSLLRANIPPDTPYSPSPPDGATNQRLSIILAWMGSDPDGDALTYDVYLETNDNTPDVLVCQDIAATSCSDLGLNPDTMYYWQVVAQDEHGDSVESPVWSFTTGNGFPGEFGKVSPPDGAELLPTNLILNWEDSLDVSEYEYCFVQGDGDCSNWTSTSTTSQVSRSGLFEGSAYRWQVRATNDYGTTYADGDIAAIWSFATGIDVPSETVLVPAGDFWMGCSSNDPFCSDDADNLPLHSVTLSEYSIDKYEVTNAQYARCVVSNSCEVPDNFSPDGITDLEAYYAHAADYPDYPVNYLSWYDAEAYCTWAGMRLPTEAEWEKAARGTMVSNTLLYPWGERSPDCSLANYYGSGYGCVGRPTRVGSYTYGASPYGVMDMAGNVSEWVSDWYDADYYSTSPTANPTGPDTGTEKVMRGGSWRDWGTQMRVYDRRPYEPVLPTYSSDGYGFRCASSVNQ